MFFYYLFAGGTCLVSAAGFYFLYDKQDAERIFYNVTWNMLGIYANLEDFYDKKVRPRIKNFFEEEEKEEELEMDNIKIGENKIIKKKFTLHNNLTNEYETVIEIPDEKKYDWGFITKKIDGENKCKICKNIQERNDEEFVVVEKPFLQVELEQNYKKIEIHENLHYFFLKNNKLFDKNFLKWYMKYWFKIELEDTYKLHIIDNSINIFTIDQSQYIILGEKDYDIKKVI